MTPTSEALMIMANTHDRFTRADAQLALRLIAAGSDQAHAEAEVTLREQGIDALLDDPRLLTGLMRAGQGAHASLALFAYVLVRHALRGAGEGDRVLADYVAAVLLHFSRAVRTTRVAEHDDEIYTTLTGLLAAVDSSDAQRSFLVRAHLGNYALWVSGIFPDWIEHRRWRRGGPDLAYYEEMGRRGFQLAAAHRLAGDLTPVFASAADRFPRLRQALNSISDQVLFPHHQTAEKLIRQVEDEARWKENC